MGETKVLHEIAFLELAIPAWQMAAYILVISLCMLMERTKLALISTYLFTLYWCFFLYWGDVVSSFGTFPNMATLFLLSSSLHITLTLVAFMKEV